MAQSHASWGWLYESLLSMAFHMTGLNPIFITSVSLLPEVCYVYQFLYYQMFLKFTCVSISNKTKGLLAKIRPTVNIQFNSYYL